MPLRTFIALTFAMSSIGLAKVNTTVEFKVSEPVVVAGLPTVTLGPGTYLLRKVESSSGKGVVQVLSKGQDYVYTTVYTIPVVRPHPDDKQQIFFSETPFGNLPALHYWFPAGEDRGLEFLRTYNLATPERGAAPRQLQLRIDGPQNRVALSEGGPADFYALRDVLSRIESGKFGAARDSFRRNHFLAQNREGAFTSFLLALLMIDREEAIQSLDLVSRLDPERMRLLVRLDVYGVIDSLPGARSDLKASQVRRFLLNVAMEMTDDVIARTAVLSFEKRVIKGDSFPVEMALDRRREEREKDRKRDEQWALAKEQIAKLSDCVKSLLNAVGALEYSTSVEATVGLFGSVRLRVVLNQRRLNDLDAIVIRSHRTICERHSRLEWLITQRNAALAKELDSLRSALRELDRQPGSNTNSQYASLRKWQSAPPSAVSRDLMMLAETATLPYMRPSSVLRTNGGYVQINIAGSLARLAEWAGL